LKKRTEVAGEALRELVLEKLTQKSAKYDRSTAKGRLKAEAIDAVAEELSAAGALDVWTRVPPSGRKPKLTREHLAATALRLADAEGIAALSMRRLATELDVGTMSLYHYVRTKDELLTLVTDAVMSEVVVPPEITLPADWRAALTIIAKRSHAALRRHPWMMDINDDPPIGPNSVRHFDQTIEAVSSLPLPLAEKLDITALVDEYVFGHFLMQRNHQKGDATDDEDSMVDYISVLLETGAYPQLEKLTEKASLRDVWRDVHRALRDEKRFERNLQRILDGIEASLPR
jgi:AcrR family transcriptional regulator